MSAPLAHVAFDGGDIYTIPLNSHAAIVGALHLCAMLGNDNKAVVMVLGYSEDWEDHTGILLEDYEPEDLEDEDCFAGYEQPILHITVQEGGTR